MEIAALRCADRNTGMSLFEFSIVRLVGEFSFLWILSVPVAVPNHAASRAKSISARALLSKDVSNDLPTSRRLRRRPTLLHKTNSIKRSILFGAIFSRPATLFEGMEAHRRRSILICRVLFSFFLPPLSITKYMRSYFVRNVSQWSPCRHCHVSGNLYAHMSVAPTATHTTDYRWHCVCSARACDHRQKSTAASS